MKVSYLLQHLSSLILPVTVLIVIPLAVEEDFRIQSIPALVIGVLLVLAGLTLLSITVYTFFTRAKGTLAPWFPTGKLMTGSLYAYVRNPMILGVLTILSGEALVFGSANIFIWLLLFFVINNLYFWLYEEPGLEKRFGREYCDYKCHVPRWIPRFRPYRPGEEDSNPNEQND